ncbi:MAG: hypothetical protein ACN4GZ_14170 [Acidimicrobiales bacterium]
MNNGNDKGVASGTSAPGSGRFGPAAVALLTITLTTWPIAFNLGAYDAVFYQDVFQIIVVSTVGFAVTLIRPPYSGRTLWLTRVALAAPAFWMALAVAFFGSLGDATADPVYGTAGLIVAIVSVPVVIKLLIDMFARDLTEVRDRGLLAVGIAIVVLIAIAGFAVGRNNDAFLTCDDFKVAGSDQPQNCASE